MEKKRRRSGCLTSLLIVTLIVVGLVVTVISVPIRFFGLGGIDIADGQTINDLGMGDLTLAQFFEAYKSLQNPPSESEIIDHPFDEQTESIFIEDNLAPVLPETSTGDTDFSSLLNNDSPVIYPSSVDITYSDTALAALLSKMFEQAVNDGLISGVEDFDLSIKQLSIKKSGSTASVTFVIKIDISQIKNELQKSISFIKLSDIMYITISNEISVDSNGKLITSKAGSIKINDMSALIGNLLLNVVFSQTGTGSEQICLEVGNLFNNIINNLGHVGSNDKINNGSITVTTYVV